MAFWYINTIWVLVVGWIHCYATLSIPTNSSLLVTTQPSPNIETPLPTGNISMSIVFHKRVSILTHHLNTYLIMYHYILDQNQNSYRQRICRLNHLHLHRQHHSKTNCLLFISLTTVLTNVFNVTWKIWLWKIKICSKRKGILCIPFMFYRKHV